MASLEGLRAPQRGIPGHKPLHPAADFPRPARPRRGPPALPARKGPKDGVPDPPAGQESGDDQKQLGLDELVDPYKLGRRSRQAFDDVWQQFVRVAQPTRSFSSQDDPSLPGASMDFGAPLAAITTVLVVGATGRIGKIILRKLLLRGYDVRALVRDGGAELPPAVEVVEGDVCDYSKCLEAVQGVDKIIYAAGARSFITADIRRVESQGISTLSRAFLDCRWKKATARGAYGRSSKRQVANFRFSDTCDSWEAELIGNPKEKSQIARGMKLSTFDDGGRQWRWRSDTVTLQQTDNGNLLFKGRVGIVGGVAEAGGPVNVADGALDNCEALVLRLKGDGNPYSMIVSTESPSSRYISRFPTRRGYSTVRLPCNTFRPETSEAPPLDSSKITHLTLRFENKGRPVASAPTADLPNSDNTAPGTFQLEVDWVKAATGGQETDFVLVSCAGAPRPGIDAPLQQTIVGAKRAGESALRNSGLGYTVVRPTPVTDEPGGYKALVFDQGDRLTQEISAADVADVCVRALHHPLARNRTFELAHEYTPEDGLQMYELVAHAPDVSTNYLGSALVNLEKNT